MRLAGSASALLRSVESVYLKTKVPAFTVGDTLRVTFRVPEGEKERQQVFEGVVISRRGGGTREMVTVRKISFGVGVERTFPLHSPFVAKLELVRRGKVRRAKLYFLREKTGKAARLKKQYGEAGIAAEAAAASPHAPPVGQPPVADGSQAGAPPAEGSEPAKGQSGKNPEPEKAAT